MRVLSAADYKTMLWKNGGGETREIAVFPLGASSDAFDWRVSLASVTASGPFSTFPGVERTIVQLSGAAMRLVHDGGAETVVLPPLQPYVFSGERQTTGEIVGPATDFNVMVRRGRFRAEVKGLVAKEGTKLSFALKKGVFLLYCVEAAAPLRFASSPLTLASGETLLVEEGMRPFDVFQAEPKAGVAKLVAVLIEPA